MKEDPTQASGQLLVLTTLKDLIGCKEWLDPPMSLSHTQYGLVFADVVVVVVVVIIVVVGFLDTVASLEKK